MQETDKGALILVFFFTLVFCFAFSLSHKSAPPAPNSQFSSFHKEVAILEEDVEFQELIRRQARSFSTDLVLVVPSFGTVKQQNSGNGFHRKRHLSLTFK